MLKGNFNSRELVQHIGGLAVPEILSREWGGIQREDALTTRKDMQDLCEVDYEATVNLYRRSSVKLCKVFSIRDVRLRGIFLIICSLRTCARLQDAFVLVSDWS